MRLDIIPGDLLFLRALEDGSGAFDQDDPIAEIEADFGLCDDSCPFDKLERSIQSVLSDPFDFNVAEASIGADDFDSLSCNLFSIRDEATLLDDWYDDVRADELDEPLDSSRKERSPNMYPYKFGDVYESNWYRKFLCPEIRGRIYEESTRDRYSAFRSYFRVTLPKVDELVERFLEEGWISHTRRIKDDQTLRVRAELLVLGALNQLGNGTPFRQLNANTEISASDHRIFFHLFLDRMYSIREEYIFYPRTEAELERIMRRYELVNLPGAGGSIDVVHLKWSACPAGDFNRCKGKEGYPTVAFQCITGFDREILGVSSIQFGTRNDKHIVKIDDNVDQIRNDWYSTVQWTFVDDQGTVI